MQQTVSGSENVLEEAIPNSSVSTSESGEKRWHVGTLTYTSAGLVALFCWLLWGDFAWSMKERAVSAIASLMLKHFDASNRLFGFLTASLPSIVGLLVGPIISYKSDRCRSRWGRRIPFLAVTGPLAAISMASLALCPMLGRLLHQALGEAAPSVQTCSLIFFATFWTIFEFSNIAAGSIFGALINDVVPVPFLGRFYGLFRAISLVVGIIFNYSILGISEIYDKAGKLEVYFFWTFGGIALLYAVGFVMMCLKVKEGKCPPPPLPENDARPGFFSAVGIYFRECFSHPYYLLYFITGTLCFLTFGPINTYSLLYAKSLPISMDLYGKYLAATYVISLCLAYFLGALVDKYHPLQVGIVAMVLYAVGMLVGGYFIQNNWTFALAFIAHGVISGTYFTTTASLGQRLLPRARFAQFASAGGLVGSLGSILLPIIMGEILDVTHNNYRLTFYAASMLGFASLAGLLLVYKQFNKLGGVKNYQAPEP